MAVVMRYEEIVRSITEHQGLIKYGDVQSVQACSYDLRVGTIIKSGMLANEGNEQVSQQGVEVLPGEIVTIISLEEITLPPHTAGIAFAMNKWSSQGLLVLNPGHIDPGFSGPLSIKALNLRKTSITLRLRDPIFTVLFFDFLDNTAHPYNHGTQTRRDYEERFQERDREITPTSISDLLRAAKDLPFVTGDQVEARMWTHGSTIISLICGVGALVVAVVALIK